MSFIGVKTTLGGLEQLISRLENFNKEQLQEQCAEAITRIILEDTHNHIDAQGNQFKPYSPAYLKKRIKMGLSEEPDLFITGTLLSLLSVEKNGIITTINDTDEPEKVEGVQDLRPFIGISQRARARIIEIVKEFVGNVVNG